MILNHATTVDAEVHYGSSTWQRVYWGDAVPDCLCLQRSLRANGKEVNFLSDSAFKVVTGVLDSTSTSKMKLLRRSGVGVTRRHAEPITQKDLLWEKQMLGDQNPTVLVDTMI